MSTHYHVLEVPREATVEELHAAWKRLARTKHPDAGGSAEEWQQVNEAFQTLRDGEKRKLYDHYMLTHFAPCPACEGTGEHWQHRGFKRFRNGNCAPCKGTGVTEEQMQ